MKHQEIEAKFRIESREQYEQLLTVLRQPTLGNYKLTPKLHAEQQTNIYYDTADYLLSAAHYGLRLRVVGDSSVATLKGPGIVHANGVHERAEWEVPATSPDPATWQPSDARNHLLHIIGSAPLLPLLTIHTTRHRIIAWRDVSVAEISLDDAVITVQHATKSFRECEIELLHTGTIADVHAVITALGKTITLIPEHRSKLEQGLQLRKEMVNI